MSRLKCILGIIRGFHPCFMVRRANVSEIVVPVSTLYRLVCGVPIHETVLHPNRQIMILDKFSKLLS